jgi:hypothetical protein
MSAKPTGFATVGLHFHAPNALAHVSSEKSQRRIMPSSCLNEYDGDYCINPGEDIHFDKRIQGESKEKTPDFYVFSEQDKTKVWCLSDIGQRVDGLAVLTNLEM